MSKESEKLLVIIEQLEDVWQMAGAGPLIGYLNKPLREVLTMCADKNIDLSAKCLRPVGEPE